ncbi:MAG: OmpA family protein [Verrucomicrobiota bacterium]
MKILVKIGVLLLMLILLFAAFVLPKFVQRAEPPMPEEDLAAALAAVELDEEESEKEDAVEEGTTAEEAPTSETLREDKRLIAFFAALDEEDFVASSDELVRLSSELEPDLVNLLTVEMEEAVENMGVEEPAESAPRIALIEDVELPEEDTSASPKGEQAPTEEAPAAPTADPTAVVAFFTLVQSGDFEAAGEELARLEGQVDATTLSSLKKALSSAQAREEERKQSQADMAKLQQESVAKLEESVKQLAAVTKAAREATKEASRLQNELDATEEAEPEDKAAEESDDPIEIPDTLSVAFGFDSTFLNGPSQELITSEVVPILEKEPRLQVQLRGHADTEGPSDYNGILARARCEVVKDFLLDQGVATDRITFVSFGETQAAANGGTAEELRRVDILFRTE